MPTKQINWKQRERRMRARYQKKVWTTGIVAAIVGLIVGFVLHAVFFGVEDQVAMPVAQPTPEVRTVYITPEPTAQTTPETVYITPEPAAEVTPQIIYITPEPTAEPTAAPATVAPEEITFAQPDATQAPIVAAEATQAPEAVGVISAAATDNGSVPTSILPAATEAPAAVATAEPVAATTAEPAATEAPASNQPIIVPYGEAVTFNTQVKKDGSARRNVEDTDYETVSLTMKVDAYKRPSYFEEHYYDSFSLKGDEAAVEFDITLNSYSGVIQIIPQNFILITLRGDSDDVTAQGYQLMDKEISGKTGVSILSDRTTTLYKRYPYSAQQGHMKYMVVTAYMDGVPQVYWFEIIDPNPVVYDTLSKGIKDHTEEVKRLQGKLKRMGLLDADEKVDGKFGTNTQNAVISAQALLGLPQTGEADNEFLHKLYDD